MKRFGCILVAMLFCTIPASAQIFNVATHLGSGVDVDSAGVTFGGLELGVEASIDIGEHLYFSSSIAWPVAGSTEDSFGHVAFDLGFDVSENLGFFVFWDEAAGMPILDFEEDDYGIGVSYQGVSVRLADPFEDNKFQVRFSVF